MNLRAMSLRTKLAISAACLIVLLTALVMVVVEYRELRAIEAQVRKRGLTIARNLAALSANALLTYNFVMLEQHVGRIAREEDVIYVIILEREGNVAAHSERSDLQGSRLTDTMTRQALNTNEPLIQPGEGLPGFPGQGSFLDIAMPVFPVDAKDRWGTVRVGLSLEAMHAEIRHTRFTIWAFGLGAALCGCLAAWVLARRITLPLAKLQRGALAVAGGDLSHRIDMASADEIGEVAAAFNRMTSDLQTQQSALQKVNRELDERLKEVLKLEQYNARILSSMTNGLVTLNLEGRVVKWNDMAAHITGYPVADVEGQVCEEVFADNPVFQRVLMDGLRGKGGSWDRSMTFVRPDNREVPLEINTSSLEDESGHITGVLGVFRDLSHVRELEQRLRRADRLAAVGRMAAMVAHEIKNPLVALKTFVEMVPRRARDPIFLARFQEIVPKEVDRVNAIMEDLLELSRPPRISTRLIHLHDVIARCIALYEQQAMEGGISIIQELSPDLPLVRADPDYLLRALGNLTLNAIQAMTADGMLTIRTGTSTPGPLALTEAGGHAQPPDAADMSRPFVFIEVSDTGTGMTPAQLDSLFTPFFTTKEKGNGIGLALTHKIIEEHQGHLYVESQFGIGSTFTILLPAASQG